MRNEDIRDRQSGGAGGLTAALLLAALAAAAPAQQGTETVIETPRGPNKRGKPQPPVQNVCWLPEDCKYVRGIIVANGMIRDLALEGRFRRVAAEEGLGTMVLNAWSWKVDENWPQMDAIFDQWAKATGHPEIRGAPALVGGLSASVLLARLVAYAAPERVFGIVHVAGGNMQHHYPEGKTLSGVPFIAMNGQFESCGPEGGIRPHLGFETQWYLMGEQMLERRRQDPNHLMSLVVVPIKGHTAWSKQLAELFIRKAARYRLPKEKRDGSKPAKCVPIRAEDGWLTDRNVKYPKHRPAAWADYTGDKTEALWHFDKEMALAVRKYHTDGIRPGQDHSLFRPFGLFDELWPLGQRMDIPFKGHTPAEYADAIRKWVVGKTGGKVDPIALRFLAESIASGLKTDSDGKNVDEAVCRKVCLRVCYAYEDAYRPVEKAIEKAELPAEFKDRLRAHYAEKLLVQWPQGKLMPRLSVRGIRGMVGGISAEAKMVRTKSSEELGEAIGQEEEKAARAARKACGQPPETLPKLIGDLGHRDAKVGWVAVDELAGIGRAAIPELVRVMDWAGAKADMRAAAALGKMGRAAEAALPDLRRMAATGGRDTETNGLVCVMALQAIDLIAKAEPDRGKAGRP